MPPSLLTKSLVAAWTACFVVFIYLPIVTVFLVALSQARYFRFPVTAWSLKWFDEALGSWQVSDLHLTSLAIAVWVSFLATSLGFLGAMAFARYDWRGRKLFQKFILLPVFFPQAVLGLALLLWFTWLGILPSWRTAVFAHLVWIAPIVTLIISIQIYGFDVAQEEAARDLGASRMQVLRDITLPALAPGIFSGALFAFLLSWGNLPLSIYTTGADSTVPEWLFSKMLVGYTPVVPAVGALSIIGATVLFTAGYAVFLFLRRLHRIA
jgi:spermidine/putrescine transport system permease protein